MGRELHMVQQKGTGGPYRPSVGTSGMEAHFLNEGSLLSEQFRVARTGGWLCNQSIQLQEY